MKQEHQYLRFPLIYRFEHWLLFLTFTTLAITGLVQKYAQVQISIWVIELFGGLVAVRSIHRIAATIMMVETIYHFGEIGYNLRVLRYKPEMMLTRADFHKAWQAFKYNLGRHPEAPRQGRYTFEEKFEYFALIWGTLVMIVTGFVLWNPIATTTILPGEFVPTAKAVHSGEALLAVLSLIVWHLYHVHIRTVNRSMMTGYMSHEEMQAEHPLELEESHQSTVPLHNTDYSKRRRKYVIGYSLISVVLLAGIYIFLTFEQTAIATVNPMEEVEVFTPHQNLLPETASFDAPMTSWEEGIGELFQLKCAFCHGGIIPLSGLDLTTYDTALLGGTTVPAIVPKQPEGSGIVQRQQAQDHAVQLTDEELEKVIAWIQNGAARE